MFVYLQFLDILILPLVTYYFHFRIKNLEDNRYKYMQKLTYLQIKVKELHVKIKELHVKIKEQENILKKNIINK